MHHLYLTKVIAWFATVTCATLSARSAFVFAKNAPRLFTVLVLFSLNWAILIPYYSEVDPSEMLAGFSGFLLVYVGVLLRREARSPIVVGPVDSTDATAIQPIGMAERIAIWLFLLLIAPSFIGLSFPAHSTSANPSTVISTLITLIGLYAMCSAVRVYRREKRDEKKDEKKSEDRGWLYLAALASLYGLVELTFTVNSIWHPYPGSASGDYWRTPPTEPMTPTFLIIYAIFKFVFTVTFIFLVVTGQRSGQQKDPSLWDEIIRLFTMIFALISGVYHHD